MFTKLSKYFSLFFIGCSAFMHLNFVPAYAQQTKLKLPLPFQKVIVTWQPIDRAVSYNLNLTTEKGDILATIFDIFPTGYEITEQDLPQDKDLDNPELLYYTVQALDYNKKPIGTPTFPKPLLDGLHFNRYWAEMQGNDKDKNFTPMEKANYLVEKDVLIPPLKLTGEFSQMGYMPVYPVFSWVKVKGADRYTIKVEKIINSYRSNSVETIKLKDSYDYYGNHPYTSPGKYRYTVIAENKNTKLAEAPWTYFTVAPTAEIIALGDSITHGGGAISTPPSQTLYNWQTYTDYNILNAGYSGNTTQSMLRRMDRDVLNFKPKYVIIMGGINDIRLGTSATEVIANLSQIEANVTSHGAIPILTTVTPLNYHMVKDHIIAPSPTWAKELEQVNDWIRTQPNYVEVTNPLKDNNGELKPELTTDGLHPDQVGKQIIGEKINTYLKNILGKG